MHSRISIVVIVVVVAAIILQILFVANDLHGKVLM